MSASIALNRRIEKLTAAHAVLDFDCGVAPLNRFLHDFALANQRAGSTQTYVALLGQRAAGYFSLTVGDVDYADAPDRLVRGLARHPVPVMVLARLAIDRGFQGQRLGQGMLLDALRRTLAAADIAGIRAIIVHAKDEQARAFYEHFGFEGFPGQTLTLYRLLKDVRAMQES